MVVLLYNDDKLSLSLYANASPLREKKNCVLTLDFKQKNHK